MKNTARYIIIALCMLNAYLLWQCYNFYYLKTVVSDIEDRHTMEQIITNDYHRILRYEDAGQMYSQMELYTEDRRAIDLQSLMQEGNKLIFRYSELHCNACVDSMVVKLREYAKEVGQDKVNIWASYSSNREYYLFLRLNQVDVPVYNVQSTSLPLDSLEEPYLFILSPDLHVSHIYIPHKEYPSSTFKYLEDVRHLLI